MGVGGVVAAETPPNRLGPYQRLEHEVPVARPLTFRTDAARDTFNSHIRAGTLSDQSRLARVLQERGVQNADACGLYQRGNGS